MAAPKKHDEASEAAAEEKAVEAAEAQASEVADPGPWWVEDSQTGHKYATYYVPEGVKVLAGESPWADAGNGVLRAAEPSGVKSADEATTEGNQK